MSLDKVPTPQIEEPDAIQPIPRGAVWLSSGDVILCAKPSSSDNTKTDQRRIFRVHREILSYQPAGLNLFLTPPMVTEPIPELEKLYKVPVLTVPERGEDLELILRVLYNLEVEYVQSFCIIATPDSPKWRSHFSNLELSQLERLTCICDVYHLPLVLERIIETLHARWPVRLAQWDFLERRILSGKSSSERSSITETASFIGFARKHGMGRLLPAAFYDLTRIESWESPVLPFASVTCSRMRPNPMTVRTFSQKHRVDAWSLLSPEDGRILSRVETAKEAGIRLFESLRLRPARREDHHGCADVQRGLCTVVASEARKTKDILTATRRHLDGKYMMLHGSCLPCAMDMVHALAVFRRSFWRTLLTITEAKE